MRHGPRGLFFRNGLDFRFEALVSPLPGDSREATGVRAAEHHAFSGLMKDVVLGRAYPPPLRGTSLEREDSINPNNLLDPTPGAGGSASRSV